MLCSQVAELLSEYVDDALAPVARAGVEEHLAKCRNCAAELASLRSYLEAMDSLPQLQAPPNFLAGVHERLEQPGWFSRLLSWLFLPMKIKLPFEAAGLVAASLLVVLLYRGLEPQKARLAPAPPTPVLEAPAVSSAPMPAAAVPKTIELVLHLTAPTDQPATPSRVAREQSLRGASSGAAAPQAQEEAIDRKVAPAPLRVPEKAEQERRASPATSLSQLKDLVVQAGGEILSVDNEKGTAAYRLAAVQLPARNYDTFVQTLHRLGRLEDPAVTPQPADPDALICVHIRLIPPS